VAEEEATTLKSPPQHSVSVLIKWADGRGTGAGGAEGQSCFLIGLVSFSLAPSMSVEEFVGGGGGGNYTQVIGLVSFSLAPSMWGIHMMM